MTKQEILELAQAKEQELLHLVSELIQIPSENPTGTQREVVDYVKKYLINAGIEPKEISKNPEFPCVLAQIGQEEGFSVILNGHVDVVPAGDRNQWDYDPFSGEITENQILGRGTSDMKAGVAGMLFAMKILAESKVKLNGNIRLHIVSDEESGGEYGSRFLCENGYADNANACLIGEPTSNNNIEIGQKGGLHLILKSYGKSAHGSLGGFKGENAILKLGKVLDKLQALTKIEGNFKESQQNALKNSKMIAEKAIGEPGVGEVISHVSANVGLIHGGTRPNMVPDYCEATVDVRLPIGVNRQEIIDTVNHCLEGTEGIECEYHWNSEGNYTEESEAIVQTVKKYAEQLWGITVTPAYQWASSDAREYRAKGIPTIQYGPANTEGIHSYNENVDIEDVIKSSQIYLLALCELMGIE